MRSHLSYRSKKELLLQIAPRYTEASPALKTVILDEFVAATGYARKAEALAELARGRLRAKLPALRLGLEGRVQHYHRFLLTRILAHVDFLEESIETVQQEMGQHLIPSARGGHAGTEYCGHSSHSCCCHRG